MIIEGSEELMAITGLGVGSYIANIVLDELGKNKLNVALNIVVFLSGGIIAFRLVEEGFRVVMDVFHISF